MSNSQNVEFSPNVENCVILMYWRLISLFLSFVCHIFSRGKSNEDMLSENHVFLQGVR